MFKQFMNSSQDEKVFTHLYTLLPQIITSEERLICVNIFLRTIAKATQNKDQKKTKEFTEKQIIKEDPTQEIAERILTCIKEYAINRPEQEEVCYHFLMYLATQNQEYMKANIFASEEKSEKGIPTKEETK